MKKPETCSRALAAMIIVLLCDFCSSADANLIAYDGFNYQTGQTVVGQGANAGWSAPGALYTISAGNSSGAVSEAVDMTPGNGLSVSGNQLQLDGVTAPGGSQGVYRNLGASYNTAGNVYWFSAQMQVDANSGAGWAGLSLFTNNTEDVFFGQRNGATTWGIEQHAAAGASSNVSTLNSSNGFLVMELNGITHQASLFINPTSLGGSAPAKADASVTFTDFSFDRFRAEAGKENMDVDEIRFGTSFADVTPSVMSAPEPNAALWGAMALIALPILQAARKRFSPAHL